MKWKKSEQKNRKRKQHKEHTDILILTRTHSLSEIAVQTGFALMATTIFFFSARCHILVVYYSYKTRVVREYYPIYCMHRHKWPCNVLVSVCVCVLCMNVCKHAPQNVSKTTTLILTPYIQHRRWWFIRTLLYWLDVGRTHTLCNFLCQIHFQLCIQKTHL